MTAQTLTHPDGRKTEYLVSGAQDGFPLLFIHGTPGSYTVGPKMSAACEGKGIKLITLSRAGYGGSSRNKGRRVVDAVADIQALLEHLGIKKCVVGGRSGGGESYPACPAAQPTHGPVMLISIVMQGRTRWPARLGCQAAWPRW